MRSDLWSFTNLAAIGENPRFLEPFFHLGACGLFLDLVNLKGCFPGEPVSGVNSPSLRVWLAPYHWKMDGKGRGSFPSLLGWFFVRGEVDNFRGVFLESLASLKLAAKSLVLMGWATQRKCHIPTTVDFQGELLVLGRVPTKSGMTCWFLSAGLWIREKTMLC